MEFTEFIKGELLVLIPVLYAIGGGLKKSKLVKSNFIPLTLTGLGLLLSSLYVVGTEGFSALALFTAIVQGVLCAGAAVLVNQNIKQLDKLDKE